MSFTLRAGQDDYEPNLGALKARLDQASKPLNSIHLHRNTYFWFLLLSKKKEKKKRKSVSKSIFNTKFSSVFHGAFTNNSSYKPGGLLTPTRFTKSDCTEEIWKQASSSISQPESLITNYLSSRMKSQ